MNLRHTEGDTVETTLLVRHLHGELDGDEARALKEHVAGCAVCRSALDALAARTRGVHEALAAADFEPPDAAEWARVLAAARDGARAHDRTGRLRMAAAWVLLLAAAAALASAPVRAWVSERWAELVARPPAEAPAVRNSAALAFTPLSPVVEVDFATRQAGGALDVRFTDAELAEIVVTGGGEERLAVGGEGVRIANPASARASYALTLPRTADLVVVRIGAGVRVEIRRGEDATVALDSGRRVRNPVPPDET